MGNKSGSYQHMENVFSGFDEYLQIESIGRDYLVAAYTGANVYNFLRFLISLLLTGSFVFFAVNVRIMNLYYLPVVFCAFGFWMMFRELLSVCRSYRLKIESGKLFLSTRSLSGKNKEYVISSQVSKVLLLAYPSAVKNVPSVYAVYIETMTNHMKRIPLLRTYDASEARDLARKISRYLDLPFSSSIE